MRSMWEWLDIQPTNDIPVIKRAYAAQAKKWHPEVHPEEFKQLQQAYKQAVRLAKQHGTVVISEDTTKTGHQEHTSMPERHESDSEILQSNSKTHSERLEPTAAIVEELKSARKLQEREEEPEIFVKKVRQQEDAPKDLMHNGRQTEPIVQTVLDIDKETEEYSENNTETSYNYNEVEQQEYLDEFWNEFYMLAKNPYLANNLVMWEYLLHQKKYHSLMQDASFHQSLILNINAIYGLRRKTVCYIDDCMKNSREEALKQGREWVYRPKRPTPDSKLWRYKKLRFWKISSVAVTKELKELHEFLLARMAKSGVDTGLKDVQSVRMYIELYLDFAKINSRHIEKWYDQGRNLQLFIKTIVIMGVVMFGFAIYVNKDMEQRRKEEQIQVSPEMVEEIRKYNENQSIYPTPYIR